MRPEKGLMVEEIRDRIKGSSSMIFTQYSGLDAQTMDRLRSLSRSKESNYMVVKNTLLKRAAEKEKIEDLGIDFKGSTGVLFGSGDAAALAKAFVAFEKEAEAFQVAGGYLDNNPLSKDQVKYLASLPSREELIAKLVGQINAPISNFVGVLSALLRNLVGALNQIKEQKEKAS